MTAPARFSDAGLAYLREHAIDPAIAERVGVREEDGALVWPTVAADGRPSLRRRSLVGGPKVCGETGAPLAAWWPRGRPTTAGALVLVAEGEADALAACCARESSETDPDGAVRFLRDAVGAVVGVPGTSFPPDRLLNELREAGATHAVLALDADEAGRRATGAFSTALSAAGIKTSMIELPAGLDLADCLAAEELPGRWLANAVLDAPLVGESELAAAPDGLLRLLTADDLLALPDPEWLIDGLVPASGLSLLYGRSGAGKSFLVLDWALCVATGLPWLGHEVKQRPVVYVAAEGRAGLAARYRAWAEAHGWPDTSLIRFLPEAVNLLDSDVVERVRRTLASLPDRPRLLVIDTMARTMVGGDENAAKDVGRFIAAVDELRADGAVFVVHHTGKDGGAERGSSALRASADLMAKLTRDGLNPHLALTCEKSKDAAEWPPVPLTLEPVAGSLVLARRVEQEKAGNDLEALVLAYIAERGPASANKITAGIQKRRPDVLTAVRALESTRRVERTPTGYVLVPVDREPPRNHQAEATGDGGSPKGDDPVGVPRKEPPRAEPDEAAT